MIRFDLLESESSEWEQAEETSNSWEMVTSLFRRNKSIKSGRKKTLSRKFLFLSI